MSARRLVARGAFVAVLTLGATVAGLAPTALAQEAPDDPPVANCGFLSAVVCQVPVFIGPINVGPFQFPNGIFGPPPSAPGTPTAVVAG